MRKMPRLTDCGKRRMLEVKMAKIGVVSRMNPGETVKGADRIEQQIDMILLTPKGSVLGNPKKGIRDDLEDIPAGIVVTAIVEDLNKQLALYIPDVKVEKIRKTVESGRVIIDISWTYKNGTGGGELRREI